MFEATAALLQETEERLEGLIAELRKQAKVWTDEASPYRHHAEYVDAKNDAGDRLTDIIDKYEEQDQ